MGLKGVLAIVVDETTEVELRRAASQLQRMETLGALAAGLTHDLNNILDTISLNVELASGTQYGTPDFGRHLSQISVASRTAAELVNRLIQFSRSQVLDYQPVQLNEIIADALHLVAPLVRENIVVKTKLESGLPLVKGDTLQLEQALVNLIINALDAMPDGGELRISTGVERRTAASGNSNKEVVAITVADTGPGIAEEHQALVFDPFFTTKPAGKGTGLGLSSTYGVVRQHQGNIAVNSTPGAGASFVISLPVMISTQS
jgi:signal transduction histidine kinase